MNIRHFITILSFSFALCIFGQDSVSVPKAYVVSNAHLDTQWNWDVQTTIREHVWKTINQNLFLLKQYPDYIFNFEGGVKYSWMKEYYPREFELVKDYIKKGRWHVSGSSWDANDAIVPSAESQIRNILLGQNFYRNEFGTESTDIFLPDCFGFGWTLPTIASHCGLLGFSSQKLGWREQPFYGDSKLPFTVGLWQGVDGSKIMMAHGDNYTHRWNDVDLSCDSTLISLAGKSPLNIVYRYYGTGDTGGSPSIASVTSVEQGLKGNGPLKVVSATSDRMYKDFLPLEEHPDLPLFNGELLMDVHGTGCYTSQAAMKLYNRQNEQLGDAAERAATIASIFTGMPYPNKSLTENWRCFIWHQFHDDLTGTSIPRAYEFSWNDELLTLKQFSDIIKFASSNVASVLDTRTKGDALVLFNPLGSEVRDVVEISLSAKNCPAQIIVKDSEGCVVPSQIVGYENGEVSLLIEAALPPVSFSVFDVQMSGKGKPDSLKERIRNIENGIYKLTFDENGDIVSLLDKFNNKELVKMGEKIRLALFPENKSFSWPAWEILKQTVDSEPLSIAENVEIVLEEDGPLRKRVKISKSYGDSKFVQRINLYEGEKASVIDFDNIVDWATSNALLKAEFPLSISNEKAIYDLGIGVVERGNNTPKAYEVPAQQWADLSDISGDYGVTVINDSKYGWDKPNDNTLRLTLIHTPQTRNNFKYQDHQDFGHHEFTYSLIGHDGSLDRVMASKQGERLNQKIKAFVSDKHKGNSKRLSLVSVSVPNVAIKALKGAEDGKGYVIRLYETSGKPAVADVIFSLPVTSAILTDGTEKNLKELPFAGNSIPVSLNANGILTMRVELDAPVVNCNPSLAAMKLPYNKKGMTWNEFRHNGEFSQGHTYAAELVPELLVNDGISFTLSPKDEKNTLMAKGQTLEFTEGNWTKLHILAAAATEEKDINATFKLGAKEVSEIIPSYTGFIGQWGHDGHTKGFLKPQSVAHVGTHRHSAVNDEPYEYTYMYHFVIDVPKGVKNVTLPDNEDIAIFAMTLSDGDVTPLKAANRHFKTAIRIDNSQEPLADVKQKNILTADMISGCSGYVNDMERPIYLVDGDETTKWCDVTGIPSTVDFDMKEPKLITGWRIVGAAEENPGYITSTLYLLGRNSENEEWKTVDYIRGNRSNVVKRYLDKPAAVRYLRLMVTTPMQDPTADATRIYELEIFGSEKENH